MRRLVFMRKPRVALGDAGPFRAAVRRLPDAPRTPRSGTRRWARPGQAAWQVFDESCRINAFRKPGADTTMPAMTSTTAPAPAGSAPLGQDAGVIGLVGLAHLVSHFSQLLLAPLFPWLKDAFSVSYAELGFLMTLFFVTSCVVQAASGFAVDRYGPRPVLFAGLALLGSAAFGYAASTSYWMLAMFSIVAGVGNGVFHPVDYTLLNRKVSAKRLGHAYSVHGITGSLGWALAPAMLVPITLVTSWRVALACAGAFAVAVLLVLLFHRDKLALGAPAHEKAPAPGAVAEGSFGFLRIPAVWMCFAFFFFYAIALGIVQAFAPGAARELHAVPLATAGLCVSVYMVCSAAAMVAGGFLAADPTRCEKLVAIGFGFSAGVALLLGLLHVPAWMVPVMFGLMGLGAGIAGPSRDMIVKRATPANASGRVYGVVYAGLDIGQAIAPLVFGTLMDHQQYRAVFIGLALVQAVLIGSAFNVGRVRRTALAPTPARA
jgi:FSR family fosmidomycin resistance protein-like MFS transporter